MCEGGEWWVGGRRRKVDVARTSRVRPAALTNFNRTVFTSNNVRTIKVREFQPSGPSELDNRNVA